MALLTVEISRETELSISADEEKGMGLADDEGPSNSICWDLGPGASLGRGGQNVGQTKSAYCPLPNERASLKWTWQLQDGGKSVSKMGKIWPRV